MGFVLDSTLSFLRICDRQHVVSNRLQYVFAKQQKLRQFANRNDFWFEFVRHERSMRTIVRSWFKGRLNRKWLPNRSKVRWETNIQEFL
jgi:hypothetical protein